MEKFDIVLRPKIEYIHADVKQFGLRGTVSESMKYGAKSSLYHIPKNSMGFKSGE